MIHRIPLILAVALFLWPSQSFSYAPVTCGDTSCQVKAGDYVEVALTGVETVQSWGFSAGAQIREGMSVNRRTGVFYWTPTNIQTGNFTVEISGFDANGAVVVSRQLTIEVLANAEVDWSAIKFVTSNDFAPAMNGVMDGSVSGPYSLDKLGSLYCKDGVTLNETIYFRGGSTLRIWAITQPRFSVAGKI
jgi:hypothetical protein